MEDIKLVGYIINNLDKEEGKVVENWIHKSNENELYFNKLKNLYYI